MQGSCLGCSRCCYCCQYYHQFGCCCRRCCRQCCCYRRICHNSGFTDAAVANAPDAAPDHVFKALCKALNTCAHDRNVYCSPRTDFLRGTGISRGENINFANAKAVSLLESQAIKLAGAQRAGIFPPPSTWVSIAEHITKRWEDHLKTTPLADPGPITCNRARRAAAL